MVRTLFILLLFWEISFAQNTVEKTMLSNTTLVADTAVRGMYSSLLGFQIDTIHSLTLYQTVSDWLNTPYHYAGKTKQGIDCSDFAKILYDSAYHIPLSGGARDIFPKVVPIKTENIQEGDLLFFKIRRRRISHVGVYLTKNKFAHATLRAGVVISDLDEPYYKKCFFKVGRMKS